MKFFKLYEKLWLIAAAIAVGIGTYNLFAHHVFNHKVYFPFFCAVFCIIVFFNKRSYRRFYEKMNHKKQDEQI